MDFVITKIKMYKSIRPVVLVFAFIAFFMASLSFGSIALAYNIVILTSKNAGPYNSFIKEFKKTLPDSTVRVVDLEGRADRGDALISKAVEDKTDLIVALGSRAAGIARERQDVPVMFSMLPESKKYEVDGRTGVKIRFSTDQQMRMFRKILPEIDRVGILYGEEREHEMDAIKKTAKKVGIEIVAKKVSDVRDVASATDDLLQKVDALWLRKDRLITGNARLLKQVILLRALRKKKPIIGDNKWTVKNGALFCLFASYQSIGAQAGELVEDLIAKGEVGFQYPSNINVLMNLNVAERLAPAVDIVTPRNVFFIR